MDTLIIGDGEIGNALYEILSNHYPTELIGKDFERSQPCEIMHIAFPYSENFSVYVREYQERFKPKFTVIHSTVPIGVCRPLNAVHSPVEGLHPFLKESIMTFTKFLSGSNASHVADYFRRANIKVYLVEDQEATEMMKIMSTTYYGMQIEFHKEVKRLCSTLSVPFELWTLWSENYNRSYEELNHPEYKRPLLVPIMKSIGAHCVMPNCELLENDFTKFLKSRNEVPKLNL